MTEKKSKKPLVIAFGSQVSGHANGSSDFDFGVLGDRPLTLSERGDFAHSLAKKYQINEDKVDLIDLTVDSPILIHEIAEKGRLLEGESFDFIRFRVRAWKKYQDTAKFRRIREQRLKKYA